MSEWHYRKMYEVIRDGNEQIERDKAETQRASELERDSSFFDVQWSLFKDKPALPLKTLLPLSVGLNPSHPCAKIEWAQKYGDKAIGKAAESLDEMLMRHGVLIEFIDAKRPEISLVDDGKTGLDRMVWPSVFVAFARELKWSLPKGFLARPDMPGSEAIKTPPAPERAKREAPEESAGKEQQTRRRLDNLKRAVLDALNHLCPRPTIQQVFDHLVTKDNTGYIRGRDGDELIWENGRGDLSRTRKKALANRLPRLIREHEASR